MLTSHVNLLQYNHLFDTSLIQKAFEIILTKPNILVLETIQPTRSKPTHRLPIHSLCLSNNCPLVNIKISTFILEKLNRHEIIILP